MYLMMTKPFVQREGFGFDLFWQTKFLCSVAVLILPVSTSCQDKNQTNFKQRLLYTKFVLSDKGNLPNHECGLLLLIKMTYTFYTCVLSQIIPSKNIQQ